MNKLNNLEQSNKMVSFAKEKHDLMVKVISFDIIYAIRIIAGYTLIP